MAYSFGAQIAEVTVDHGDRPRPRGSRGRGPRPRPRHQPQDVEGQIDGQVFSGMSQVLYEELLMDDGQPLNPSRLEYKMPRSFEVPEVEHILVETIDPYGPFGAKEVGEGPIVAHDGGHRQRGGECHRRADPGDADHARGGCCARSAGSQRVRPRQRREPRCAAAGCAETFGNCSSRSCAFNSSFFIAGINGRRA